MRKKALTLQGKRARDGSFTGVRRDTCYHFATPSIVMNTLKKRQKRFPSGRQSGSPFGNRRTPLRVMWSVGGKIRFFAGAISNGQADKPACQIRINECYP